MDDIVQGTGHSVVKAAGFYGGEVPRSASRRLGEMERRQSANPLVRAGRAVRHGTMGVVDGYEYLMGVREDWLRISKALMDWERIQRGQRPVSFVIDTRGLTALEAAGKVAREFPTDYGAISERFAELRTGTFPMLTWYVAMSKYWSTYLKLVAAGRGPLPLEGGGAPPPGGTPPPPPDGGMPGAAGAGEGETFNEGPSVASRVGHGLGLGMAIGGLLYWNWSVKGEQEQEEEDYLRGSLFHLNMGLDENGKNVVWYMPMGPDVVSQMIGWDEILPALQKYETGKITQEELTWAIGKGLLFSLPQELIRQTGPVWQVAQGLATNRDPWTHREIVPSPLKVSTTEGRKLQAEWIARKMVPVLQVVQDALRRVERDPDAYAGDSQMRRFLEALRAGPLGVERAVGIRRSDPLKVQMQENNALSARFEAERSEHLYRLEQAYIRARVDGTEERWKAYRDAKSAARHAPLGSFQISPQDWENRLKSPRVRRDLALAQANAARSQEQRAFWMRRYEREQKEMFTAIQKSAPLSVRKAVRERTQMGTQE